MQLSQQFSCRFSYWIYTCYGNSCGRGEFRKRHDTSNSYSCNYTCPTSIYPNIFNILQIFATLPVSIAGPERIFSEVKHTLTDIRTPFYVRRTTGGTDTAASSPISCATIGHSDKSGCVFWSTLLAICPKHAILIPSIIQHDIIVLPFAFLVNFIFTLEREWFTFLCIIIVWCLLSTF